MLILYNKEAINLIIRNMYKDFQNFLSKELESIDAAGLFKRERVITTPQQAAIKVSTGQEVLNFCANNYLGLSNNPELIKASKEALEDRKSTRLNSSHRT